MPPITRRLFKLPARSSLSLRDQICEAVSSAITSQALPFDQPLPSCRELAAQLTVSRNTVFAAYNRLIDLGLLTSRDRSGYYVSSNAEALKVQTRNSADSAGANDGTPTPMTFASSNLTPIDNPTDWSDYPYPFLYNQIDPNLFPVDGWRECSRQALGRKEIAFWTGDSVESDSPQLIQQLRQRLLGYRGIHARDDEILITLGAQNALFIVSLLFPRDGRRIAVEDPGFQGARNAFLLAGHELVGVPVDREGNTPSRQAAR